MRKNTVYKACPYCLTEITTEKQVLKSAKPKTAEESKSEEKTLAKEKHVDQTVSETTKCKHYFGYLSKRSPKESIPEECIICEKMVQCMLKTITD